MRPLTSRRRRDCLGAAAFLLALGCAACAEEPPDTGADEGNGGAPSGRAGQEGQSSDAEERPVPLTEMNGSGVAGEVVAMQTDGAVVIVLEARGLPGPREYGAFVHRGRCGEDTAVSTTLNPIVGLADSTGTSTTVLDPSELATGTPLSVRLLGNGDAALACGDLSARMVPAP